MADTSIGTPNSGDPKKTSIDIKDLSAEFLANQEELNKRFIQSSYNNFDALQKEVSEKQKDFMKDYYAEQRRLENDYHNARGTNQKAAALLAISNLREQREAFKDVADELKRIQDEEAKRSQKIWDTFTLGFTGFLRNIKESYKGNGGGLAGAIGAGGVIVEAIKPIAKFILDILFGNDKLITDIAKTMGTTKDDATGIAKSYQRIAAEGKNILVNAVDLVEANSQIISQYKILGPVSADIAKNQAFMTKNLGMSADEAARFNSMMVYNKTQGKEGLDIVYKQVAEYANQNKILFSGKAILSEVSKISGQIRATFKGSTEEMAKAVIEASRLGTTLEQSKSMSEALLNFESSVDNELKAELLTGQQLNLEKARALALSGKYVEAGKEMLTQAGGLANFEKMNVIQQKAMAEAVGLTADQLSDIKYKQSEIGMLAGDLAMKYEKIGNTTMADRLRSGRMDAEQLKVAESQLTAQQKFEASMEKVKQIFAEMITNNVLDKFASMLERFVNIWASDGFISAVTGDYSGKSGSQLKSDLSKEGTSDKQLKALAATFDKEASDRAKDTLDSWWEGAPISKALDKVYAAIDPTADYAAYQKAREQGIKDQYKEEMNGYMNELIKAVKQGKDLNVLLDGRSIYQSSIDYNKSKTK